MTVSLCPISDAAHRPYPPAEKTRFRRHGGLPEHQRGGIDWPGHPQDVRRRARPGGYGPLANPPRRAAVTPLRRSTGEDLFDGPGVVPGRNFPHEVPAATDDPGERGEG